MRAAIVALLLAAPAPAFAQKPPPAEREMSTDRPDKTESPYTVPDGRIQIELDLANYTRDRDDGVRTETIGVAPFNLKLGLDDRTDVQLVVAPYTRQTETRVASGARRRIDGFGDVTVRLKHNLWGDDAGTTAFALMPFVTIPTSRAELGTDLVEFGLIAPLAVKLSDTIDLGLMTEVDLVADEDGEGRSASFVNSATLGFSLTDRLGMYTEVFTEHSAAWVITGDLGFTYAVSGATQFDAGVNLGLNQAADDVTVFIGLSRRF